MAVEMLTDTTMLIRVENLARQDTGAPIVTGVVVTGDIFRSSDLTTPLASVTLAHVGSGDWEVVVPLIGGLVVHEKIDVRWKVDGGSGLSRVWWSRNVQVHDSRPEV